MAVDSVGRLAQGAGDAHGRSTLAFCDADGYVLFAVVAAEGVELFLGLKNVGDIRKVDDLAGGKGKGKIFEVVGSLVADAAAQRQIVIAAFDAASRQGEVGVFDQRNHGGHIQAVLLHLFLNELYRDIILLSAVNVDVRNAGELFKLRDDFLLDIIFQVDVSGGGGGKYHNRHRVHIHLDDGRSRGVVGKLTGIHFEVVAQIDVRLLHVGAIFHLKHDQRNIFQ